MIVVVVVVVIVVVVVKVWNGHLSPLVAKDAESAHFSIESALELERQLIHLVHFDSLRIFPSSDDELPIWRHRHSRGGVGEREILDQLDSVSVLLQQQQQHNNEGGKLAQKQRGLEGSKRCAPCCTAVRCATSGLLRPIGVGIWWRSSCTLALR